MYQVIKRDGKITSFDLAKISAAITKAFEAQNKQYNPDIIDLLALKVTADYEKKIRDGKMTLEKVPLYWRKVTEKWLEEHPEG